MAPIDIRSALLVFALIGAIIGMGACKACGYLSDHVRVDVEWVDR